MKLKTYLHNVDHKRIKELTEQHGIYYNPDFSRRWISNQVTNKLAQGDYLKKLINNQFNKSEQQVLKKLLTTESINKNSLDLTSYHKLLDYGSIYKQSDFCYLFSELKPLLKNILSTSTFNKDNSTPKKFKFGTEVKVKNNKSNLSFFHYLVLILSQIKYFSKTKEKLLTEKQLLSFLKKINFTKLHTNTLYHKLLNYSYNYNLISKQFKIKPEFKSWLQSSQQQKILSAIDTFFPKSESALRKIIAVLSHYPLSKKIPLDFAQQELHLQKINTENKELLKLLTIMEIKEQEISLSKEAWHYFNPQVKFKFKVPVTKEEKIIVSPQAKLEEVWKVAINHRLISINKQLIFEDNSYNTK
ncbi:hypothetical protein [Halanaerobacter jeridensis]|uniref:Uncharacterized protein n=1 Tax=Halanaerobacter jeridensis TaxID=706427 RepID=A0A938XWK3_9FIRM|nr:hypothetical protein [Halanaerobacter jeridensis]MBM7556605.1 hypothetical protein [Halanaerobacter jeridensis]